MSDVDLAPQLSAWFAGQLSQATDVRIEGLNQVQFGHSAEMLALTVVWRLNERDERRDVIVRIRPPAPGLLEPYNLRLQFDILRALEETSVLAPRALWIEETGNIIGRPFYVMERLDGTVYEQNIPKELADAPDRIHRMSRGVIEQIAAIHLVDLQSTGLNSIEDGSTYLDRELSHWGDEMHRVQRGPLPALELLLARLKERRPDPTPRITLVHGDTKGGNFAFVGDRVSGIFDWEMASIGDPMADIGWLEVTWAMSVPFSELSPSDIDRLLRGYEELTGIAVHDRPWYRALQAFKMAVIMLVGAMLVDAGFSDDWRLATMGSAVPMVTVVGLRNLGIEEEIEAGPVTARRERLEALRRSSQAGH